MSAVGNIQDAISSTGESTTEAIAAALTAKLDVVVQIVDESLQMLEVQHQFLNVMEQRGNHLPTQFIILPSIIPASKAT